MKKFLLGLLVVAMVIGLTACSPEVSSKLGNAMGKMGNNIYGIKANMVQVEKATETVDNSVTKDESGNVTAVDLTTAAQVMNSISSIKGSDQKREALKASLSQPVSTGDQAAVQVAIANSANAQKEALASSTDADEYAQLKTALTNALAAVETSLTESPTKAELATVAVLSEMADAIMTEGITEAQLAQKGQDALDTLKVISDFGGISLINDEILDSLISTRSISRDDEEQSNIMAEMYSDTVAAVIEMLVDDNKAFSEANYRSFILQAKAMKAAYDMISAAYITDPTDLDQFDAVLTAKIDHGLSTEDLVKYIVCWVFTEIDVIEQTFNAVVPNLVTTVLNPIITNNYEFLTDLKTATATGAEFNSDGISDELIAQLVDSASTFLGDDSNDGGDFDKLLDDLQDAFANTGSTLSQDFFRLLGTSVVIIVDASWDDSLFALASMATGDKIENVSGLVTGVQGLIMSMIEDAIPED